MEKIFKIISIGCFIISFIFLLTQGIINNIYLKSKDKEIIAERTVLEQFSYEVYSSINTAIPIGLNVKNKCNYNEEPIKIHLHSDTFYDCRGIYNSDLNWNCRNQIVDNYTTCASNGRTHLDFSNNNKYIRDLKDYDERVKYCQYYSNYTQTLTKIFSQYICKSQTKTYSELLSNSVPSKDYYGNPVPCPYGYKKCGILDTKDNILCIPKSEKCPVNEISISSFGVEANKIGNIYFNGSEEKNSKIITSIILSENKPSNHEWDKLIKENYENIDDEESNRRRIVSKNDFLLLDKEDFNNYESRNIKIQMSDLISGFNFKKFELYNRYQDLTIYTRNYIGFKNVKEFNKFKKYFKDNDIYFNENPLYKLSSLEHDPLITIIFSAFFLFLGISFLIIIIINFFKGFLNEKIKDILLYCFIFILIVNFVADLIIISYHYSKCPLIYIDMDARMKSVLNRYNKRTIMYQLFRIISGLFLVFSGIFITLYFYKKHHNNNL